MYLKEQTKQNVLILGLSYFRQQLSILVSVDILTIATLLIIATMSWFKGIPISFLTRDPAAIVEQPFYIGILSNIGILLWCSCTAICLFSYCLLKRNNYNQKYSNFLLFSGILTLILLIDDFFLLHEEVFPYHLKISEKYFYVGYLTIIFLYLIKSMKIILETEYIILGVAFLYFGLSLGYDIFFDTIFPDDVNFLIEDGLKLLGIVNWFLYFIRVCTNLTSKLTSTNHC